MQGKVSHVDPYERRTRDPRSDPPKQDQGPATQAWRPTDGAGVQPSWRREESRPGQTPASQSPATQSPANQGPATQAWRPNDLRRSEPDPAPPTEARTPAAPAASEPAKQAVQVRRLRRGRLAIRKISPWATFKFSLVFYFCMLLIMLLGTAIIFAALKAFGVVSDLENLLAQLDFDVSISGGLIFRWFFLIGLVGTLIASAVTVFMAFLYNLIADVVGGIEILVTERE